MNDYFDIYGTPIKYSSIKEFRIVQREYIYRPVYVESIVTEQKFMKKSTYSKYDFLEMRAYAAIVDESDRRGVFGNIKTNTFGESVGKELLGDIRETVGEKFNVKAIKAKKYKCIMQSGRVVTTYLDDVPALIVRTDGRVTDVTKEDAAYLMLGESIMPAINTIHALLIQADQQYIFYGNGVQIENIQAEYERLKFEYEQYNLEKKSSKKLFGQSKTDILEKKPIKELANFPKLGIPSFKKASEIEVGKEQEIGTAKRLLEEGAISEEDYKERIQQIIDSI